MSMCVAVSHLLHELYLNIQILFQLKLLVFFVLVSKLKFSNMEALGNPRWLDSP